MAITKLIIAQQINLEYVEQITTEVNSGAIAQLTNFEAESKLVIVTDAWEKISRDHKIMTSKAELPLEIPYFKDKWFLKAKVQFVKAESALKARINELEPRSHPSAAFKASFQESVQQRAPLPTIKPPEFSANIIDWPSFKSLFLSVVEKQGVTEVDKMHYLTTSIQGNAASLIANIPITNEAFNSAWTALQNRYENKRLLISAQLNRLFTLRRMASRTSKELNTVINTVTEVLNSLRALGSPVQHWDQLLVHLITHRLDLQTREDWELTLGSSTKYPALERLTNFLMCRARALETMEGRLIQKGKDKTQPGRINTGKQQSPKASHVHVARSSHSNSAQFVKFKPTSNSSISSANYQSSCNLSQPDVDNQSPKPEVKSTLSFKSNYCSCCGGNHFVVGCPNFQTLDANQRFHLATSRALCINCLGTHQVKDCRSTRRLRKSHQHLKSEIISRPTVLLATAQALILTSSRNSHPVRLLIDPGSEITLISQELFRTLNLAVSNVYIPIVGVGSVSSGETEGAVNFTLLSRFSTQQAEFNAHILPNLTVNLPSVEIFAKNWPHLHNLELADPDFLSPGKIAIIIGADSYGKILRSGVKSSSPNEPTAFNTMFGWTILGPVDGSSSSAPSHTGFIISNEQLHDNISKFWEIEDVSSHREDSLSVEEAECEAHLQSTHTRDTAGRYVVRLQIECSTTRTNEAYRRKIAQ
ncbi:uncharacterized protein LOC119660845 [Hermetia illucens]|uniref:uncharacterized protein LOC119660845 n=1 Tax=Hermetia illucens TaxID=343691 RepID=UPI0018CC211F|nr:uncharacterized protein LOC119660845 [Hermetia illucens]